MKKQVFLCLLVSAAWCVNGQEELCTMPDGGAGLCKAIDQCPDATEKINSFNTLSAETQATVQSELVSRQCGFENIWKVCCSDCKTPDNKSGLRKHLRDCPHLVKMLRGTAQQKIFARQSRIGKQADVCCGSGPEHRCNSIISTPPDPSTKCCGVDTSAGNRIIGGKSTEIEEYPWTVLLEYDKDNQTKLYCGGSLISNRFVLTAAHCFEGKGAWPPKAVRVGEYDTQHEGKDCKDQPDGTQKCTDGKQTIGIEWYRLHPEYEPLSTTNDIAIIKLKKPVNYTVFVRPICLPSADLPVDPTFYATGWGKLSESSPLSRFKQSVKLGLFTPGSGTYQNEKCQSQICAGGELGKDSCKGDSGGPLMLQLNEGGPHFEVAGVVSTGPKHCGTEGVPGVYTRVFRYIDWIRNTIKE